MPRSRWWNTRRFDLVEVVLLSLSLGFAVFLVGPRTPPRPAEEVELDAKYGPGRFSENEEEWIIRDFFKDKRNGVFVDVGAGHYGSNSNTYYLERQLGWSGLAIEPLRHFEADYIKHRSRARFLPFFVSDVSDQQIKMYTLGEMFAGSSSDPSFVARFGENAREVTVPTITLDDLLEREQVQAFDFMSMDIELSEPKALAGFSIERYRPALVCIEAHPEVRQQILDYFTRHHYVIVAKYLRVDEKNLYFTPLTGT